MGLTGDPQHLPDLRSALRTGRDGVNELVESYAVAGLGKLAEARTELARVLRSNRNPEAERILLELRDK